MKLIEYRIEGHALATNIATIVLSDVERLNAMSENMAKEFSQLVGSLIRSKKLPRAIVIEGAGRAFSAGGDLGMLEQKRKLSAKENKKKHHSIKSTDT